MLACEETEDFITLGASCTIKDMSTLLGKHFPYMVPYLEDFASEQIRGKATIGGSLADGSPWEILCPVHGAQRGMYHYGP
jgi:xanthine dehydrogenase small subunit